MKPTVDFSGSNRTATPNVSLARSLHSHAHLVLRQVGQVGCDCLLALPGQRVQHAVLEELKQEELRRVWAGEAPHAQEAPPLLGEVPHFRTPLRVELEALGCHAAQLVEDVAKVGHKGLTVCDRRGDQLVCGGVVVAEESLSLNKGTQHSAGHLPAAGVRHHVLNCSRIIR